MTRRIIIDPDTYDAASQELSSTYHHAGYVMRLELGYPQPVEVIDAEHLYRQRAFSMETFGPGHRHQGVLDHIRKELAEIEADGPGARSDEWFDVIILALDGAWRAGWMPQEIIDGIVAKQTKNEGRTWPDWRTADPDKAIEHNRAFPQEGEGT